MTKSLPAALNIARANTKSSKDKILKVLFFIDHAPDYREAFFQALGANVDLTVVAQPCSPDGLTAPSVRCGYKYIEVTSRKSLGIIWQPRLGYLLRLQPWDIVCCDLNLRHLSRIALFMRERRYWNRWVWWGHIIGRNSSRVLDHLRRFLLSRGAGCLAYSNALVEQLSRRYGIEASSLNNTQIRQADFRVGHFSEHTEIRLLFVGRCQPRKRLERLIALATRRSDVSIRLVGPGMDKLRIPNELHNSKRIEVFPQTTGKDLNQHFDWADLVANPGHVGLLVMNTAQHGKGIVIDSDSLHAPEYWLAKEADQPFISFGNPNEVDQFIDRIKQNRKTIEGWGNQLQSIAREKYTIEAMAKAHLMLFEKIHFRALNNGD